MTMKTRLRKLYRQLQQQLAVGMVTTVVLAILSISGSWPFVSYMTLAALVYCLVILGLWLWVAIELHR